MCRGFFTSASLKFNIVSVFAETVTEKRCVYIYMYIYMYIYIIYI